MTVSPPPAQVASPGRVYYFRFEAEADLDRWSAALAKAIVTDCAAELTDAAPKCTLGAVKWSRGTKEMMQPCLIPPTCHLFGCVAAEKSAPKCTLGAVLNSDSGTARLLSAICSLLAALSLSLLARCRE